MSVLLPPTLDGTAKIASTQSCGSLEEDRFAFIKVLSPANSLCDADGLRQCAFDAKELGQQCGYILAGDDIRSFLVPNTAPDDTATPTLPFDLSGHSEARTGGAIVCVCGCVSLFDTSIMWPCSWGVSATSTGGGCAPVSVTPQF